MELKKIEVPDDHVYCRLLKIADPHPLNLEYWRPFEK